MWPEALIAMTITGIIMWCDTHPDALIISWASFLVITLLFSMRWPSDE